MNKTRHHVVLVPGLFGFAQLGGFDYFAHVEEALGQRYAEAGLECDFVLVSSPPTGSIVWRAQVLLETVERTCGDEDGPIHLIGHSTGGLDLRLLASPTTRPGLPAWFDRVQTATTISTPHYGTPVAHDLTTLAGTRLLYALSLLTFGTLRFGGPPMTVLSPLIASLGKIDAALGLDIKVLDRTTDLLLGFLSEEGLSEVRDWFDGIRADRGAIIQLTPESMDIFNAAVEDNPSIRYGCVVTRTPPPGPVKVAASLLSPVRALSAALFTTLYVGASRPSSVYPSPTPVPEVQEYLEQRFGEPVQPSFNDGLVPTLSQLWGDIVWAGTADHLDILGHFQGDKDLKHTDWQVSGAGFDEPDFDEAMDAIADYLLGTR
jgi:triacylglycerol esterase/lipase EstA (alpha/beta hydrolase family)